VRRKCVRAPGDPRTAIVTAWTPQVSAAERRKPKKSDCGVERRKCRSPAHVSCGTTSNSLLVTVVSEDRDSPSFGGRFSMTCRSSGRRRWRLPARSPARAPWQMAAAALRRSPEHAADNRHHIVAPARQREPARPGRWHWRYQRPPRHAGKRRMTIDLNTITMPWRALSRRRRLVWRGRWPARQHPARTSELRRCAVA
jgi:hypothetical protein